jgi:membrane protein DedA with SNARE-associated domain
VIAAGELLLAWVIAFAINLAPAFAPPTWAVLAVFHVTTDLPILALTIGGAAASAGGRLCLALGARRLRPWLPEKDRENAEALGDFVTRHRNWRVGIVFLYCLGPFPSNALFIAAGIGRVPLASVTVAFFASRCIADTLWVWLAGAVAGSLRGAVAHQYTNWQFIVLQVLMVAAVLAVLRLPWARWFGLTAPEGESIPAIVDGRQAAGASPGSSGPVGQYPQSPRDIPGIGGEAQSKRSRLPEH